MDTHGNLNNIRFALWGLIYLILVLLFSGCIQTTEDFVFPSKPSDISAYETIQLTPEYVVDQVHSHRLPSLDNKSIYYSYSIECSLSNGETIEARIDDTPDLRMIWEDTEGIVESGATLKIWFVPDDPRNASYIQIMDNMGNTQCLAGETQSETEWHDDFVPLPFGEIDITSGAEYLIWIGVGVDTAETVFGTIFFTTDAEFDPYGVHLNPWGEPSNVKELNLDFAPDPMTIEVTGTSSVNIEYLELGSMWAEGISCDGFATSSKPQLRFTWSCDTDLRLYFVPEDDAALAKIILHATDQYYPNPTTDWYFAEYDPYDPDVLGNPLISVCDSAWSDRVEYNLWLAGYNQGDNVAGTLYVSQLDFDTTHPSGVDKAGIPILGREGFDGQTIQNQFDGLRALVDAANLDEHRCSGFYTTLSPTFVLDWPGGDNLEIHALFDPNSISEKIPGLIVMDPHGVVECNSPAASNPSASYAWAEGELHAGEGEYLIWVASRVAGTELEGQLCITDFEDVPENPCR